MKKSKIFVVIALAVVLCVVSVTSTTFSWFYRPKTLTGNSLLIPSAKYDLSNGNDVSFVTYESTNGGKTYGSSPVTDFNATISAGGRKMYRTDIVNTSSQTQSVSLFLNTLNIGSSGDFYLGVNNPLKTYKPYGKNAISFDTKESFYVNKRNYYVGFVNDREYTPGDYFIHYWHKYADGTADSFADASVDGSKKLAVRSYTVPSYSDYTSNYDMYCIVKPIPYDANELCFMTGSHSFDAGNNTEIDRLDTVIWFHYDNNYHSAYMDTSGEPAGIKNFYSSANVKVNNTIDLAAEGQGTITYSSSNSSIASVNAKGEVKGVGKGTATITATSTGEFGDKITSTCSVTVYDGVSNLVNSVPVVTNIKLEAHNGGDETAVESVYWYIKNGGSSDMTYTVSSLDLTL